MRRIILFAHTILLCLMLASCGGKQAKVDAAAEIRSRLLQAEEISCSASLRCDYDDRIWDCKLRYSGSIDAGTITVLAPDLIAGLEISVNNGLSTLHYDGAVLDTGEIFGEGISAVETLPLFLNAWAGAHIRETYTERRDGAEYTVLVLELSVDKQVIAWFDSDSIPHRAELTNAGKSVVFCTFDEFTYS